MSTSDELVRNSLLLIRIIGAETPISATESADGRSQLNRLAAQLEAEGFELGFTPLTSGSDTVTIPDYAEDFFTNQLAARLASTYATEVTPFLTESIQASRRVVVRQLNRKAVGQTGTFQDLVYGAIELMDAKSADEPISTAEMENSIPRLNDMMLEFEARGLLLGYQVNRSNNLAVFHELPDWSWSWIKAELAIRLSSSYSAPLNQVIIEMARKGERDAYNRVTVSPTTNFPENLPVGESRCQSHEFYGDPNHNGLLGTHGNPLLTDENDPILRGYGDE